MTSSRIFSLCALLAVSLSSGCSSCDPKEDPPGTVTCSDGAKNGDETAVDCGGATCVAEGKTCADSLACTAAADCTSGYCNPSSVCSTPSCTDTWKNGTETGVDCGGAACVALGKTCADGLACAAPTDCTSAYCDATFQCAPACLEAPAACTRASDCCSGLCDDTNHCATPCTATGSGCATPGECCTGLCSGSPTTTCQPPPSCTDDGFTCAVGGDCCSGFCDGTVCATPCAVNGDPCAAGGDCCSAFCDATNHCANPCLQNGTACGTDGECCTGICTGTPTKACAPAPTCTATGSACPAAPGTCCSGVCNAATGNCALPCKENGVGCAFGTDCCSTYCDPTKVCDNIPSCKATGATCGGDTECCDQFCNGAGFCEVPVSTCDTGGVTCAINADCCSTACNQTTHTCTTDAFGGTVGDPCVSPTDCLSGTCTAGLCSDTVCQATGTVCGAATDCCTGLCSGTPSTTCQPLPGASACKTEGDSCTLPGDCCSTNCQGGKCIPAYTCNAANDICYRDDECCSGLCDATAPNPGRCILNPGGCNQDGNPCSGASNCCTRTCVDLGSGVTVCKPAPGCRMTGDYCDRTESCCGGSPDGITAITAPGDLNPYKIYCDTTGVNDTPPANDPSAKDEFRCSGGTACNPPGNICGAAGDPASQNCCAGKKAVCKRDSAGIARCFGGCPNDNCGACPTGYDATDPACCIPPGPGPESVCQFRDQCCNFAPCVPGEDGVLRCTLSTCTALHAGCTGADDPSCCAGTVCTFDSGDLFPGLEFTCEVPVSCALNGQTCNVASDCCSNNCSGGFCAPPCVSTGGSCTQDECCSGLSCVKETPTAPDGFCQPVSACAPTATACSDTKPCCNAPTEQCISGFCEVPPTCAPEFEACTADGDCCLVSPALSCVDTDGTHCAPGDTTCSCASCNYLAQGCGSPANCCLGLTCDTTSNTCATCATLGSGCTSQGDCCSTLYCSEPGTGYTSGCATAGTCACDTCLPVNTACTFGGPSCCGAAQCLTATNSGCGETDTDCTCVENL